MGSVDVRIVQYGIFDSSVSMPEVTETRNRLLSKYEFELYPADCAGTAYIDDVPYLPKAGLLLCVKPGQHRRSRMPFKCCCLHLEVESPALARELNRLPTASFPTDADELTRVFYKMAMHERNSLADELFLQSCADRILYLLLTLTENPASDRAIDTAHTAVLRDIRSYMRKNFAEPLPLSRLAEMAALSPIYFHRLFTQFFGITPARFLLKERIGAARRLLLTTDTPIADIAAECGFSSQSHFNDSFKKQTGRSPAQYRKEMLSRVDL